MNIPATPDATATRLAPSLATQLHHTARCVLAVEQGHSLSEVLPQVAAGLRPGVQALTFHVLRRLDSNQRSPENESGGIGHTSPPRTANILLLLPPAHKASPDHGFEGNGYGRASEDFNHVFKEGLCFVGVHRSHLVLAGFGSAQLDVEHSTVLVYVR